MSIQIKKSNLPKFCIPNSLNEARSNIEGLGKNMAEHAYLIGCNLIWIKSKLKHGEFLHWIEKNVWFKQSTAGKYIRYTKHCRLSNSLENYPIQANSQNLLISNDSPQIKKGQFRTIIIDPPWPYGTQYEPDTRRVASPYPELTIEAIAGMDLPAANDCILWLWTTHKFLPVSFEIIEDWGFDYKANLVWNKESMGVGYWLRMQCEFCLLGIMGEPIWRTTNARDFISEARREHSRKPEAFYNLILDICPSPIGECFPRQKRKGIEVIIGNEENKF